jgi:hypothetical protein
MESLTEKKAHDLIRHLLQNIWDEHKLCITDIDVGWLKIQGVAGPNKFITTLEIRSKTYGNY